MNAERPLHLAPDIIDLVLLMGIEGAERTGCDGCLTGPVWLVRTIARLEQHARRRLEEEGPPGGFSQMITHALTREPGAATLEAAWRLGGLMALIKLIEETAPAWSRR